MRSMHERLTILKYAHNRTRLSLLHTNVRMKELILHLLNKGNILLLSADAASTRCRRWWETEHTVVSDRRYQSTRRCKRDAIRDNQHDETCWVWRNFGKAMQFSPGFQRNGNVQMISVLMLPFLNSENFYYYSLLLSSDNNCYEMWLMKDGSVFMKCSFLFVMPVAQSGLTCKKSFDRFQSTKIFRALLSPLSSVYANEGSYFKCDLFYIFIFIAE